MGKPEHISDLIKQAVDTIQYRLVLEIEPGKAYLFYDCRYSDFFFAEPTTNIYHPKAFQFEKKTFLKI